MSDSDNESICTYYSSSSSSFRSNDEIEEDTMDYLEEEQYYEYYDDMEAPQYENVLKEPEIETKHFQKISTKVPAVNPWKKKDISSTMEEKPKSFLDIMKEETEKSKLEKIELEKKKEFEKKYKNRPNFNFSNTHNSRTRLTTSTKKHVSLLKPLKSKL